MSYRMLRLKIETGKKLDVLTIKYEYKNVNDCVFDMIIFFIENGLNPNTKLNLKIHKEIQDLNNSFKKRDDSIRKWFGEIFHKKVLEATKQNDIIIRQNELILDLVSEEFKKEIKNESNINLKKNTSKKELDKDTYFKVLEQKDKTINDLKNKFNLIISKAVKNNGSKVFYSINLNEMEMKTLKNL